MRSETIATGAAKASTTGTRRWEQLAAATGIMFVLLQLASLPVMGSVPALDDPTSEIRDYLVDDGGNVLLAATLLALAAFFFLWFLGSVRALLRVAEGGEGRLSAVAFGGGVVTITLAVAAILPTVALAWDDTAARADEGLLHAVWNLNTLALVPIGTTSGVFTLAVAVVILRTRVLPVWLAWIGVVATVLGVISVFYLVADDPDTPLGIVNLAGFLSAMLFILLLSIVMVVRLGRTEPATA
jgi:hypothetical protein